MKKLYLITLSFLLPAAAAAQTNALNPLGDISGGAPELYGRIIRVLLGFSGVAALIFFIIGGITLLTSGGNPDKVTKGKQTIVWAIIGLAAAFFSYTVLRFVIQSVITR